MPRRTLLLLALLGVIGAGVWHVQRLRDESAAPVTITYQSRPQKAPPQIAQTPSLEDSRVEDAAAVLAPFVPRLGRMADEFSEDVGIDVRIVTINDAGSSIEEQANEMFESKQIGRDSPVGGLLIVLNPRMAKARIEDGMFQAARAPAPDCRACPSMPT